MHALGGMAVPLPAEGKGDKEVGILVRVRVARTGDRRFSIC